MSTPRAPLLVRTLPLPLLALALAGCADREPVTAYDGLVLVAPTGPRLVADAGAAPAVVRSLDFDDPDETGWSVPSAGAFLSDGGALTFRGDDRARVAVRRVLSFACADVDELRLRVRGGGLLFVKWRAEDDGDAIQGRAVCQVAGAADAWTEVTSDLAGNPAWRGALRELTIEMVNRGGDLAVDWLRFVRTPLAERLARLDSDHGALLRIGTERRRARPLSATTARAFDLAGAAAGDRLRFAVGVPEETARRSGPLVVHVRGAGLDEPLDVDRRAGWKDVEFALPAAPDGPIEVALRGGPEDHVLLTQARVAKGTRSTRPNVLLVTIDTLRRDVLGCYGDPVTRTPHLDALARAGTLFERTTTAANVTAPSHASILSSMFLKDHGLYNNNRRMSPKPLLLAEHLSGDGYATAAAIGSVVLTPAVTNLGQGFSTFFDTHEAKRKASDVNEDIVGWLEERAGEPWFAWVHYYDPHTPYDQENPYLDDYYDGDPRDPAHGGLPFEPRFPVVRGRRGITDVEYLVALYRAEVTAVDAALGALLDELDDLGMADDTIVVVTADHGESLTEHEVFFNHEGLFPETVLVPWIARAPGAAGGVRARCVAQTIDVAPTILAALGRPVPAEMRGVARPLGLDAPGTPGARQYFEHSSGFEVGVRSDRYHAILTEKPHRRGSRPGKVQPGLELFEWVADAALADDFAEREPALARKLTEHLRRWKSDRVGLESLEAEMSAEHRAALEQLGYLGDDE